jgi:hypothetical protein
MSSLHAEFMPSAVLTAPESAALIDPGFASLHKSCSNYLSKCDYVSKMLASSLGVPSRRLTHQSLQIESSNYFGKQAGLAARSPVENFQRSALDWKLVIRL